MAVSFIVEDHLTACSYLHFLQNKITLVLEEVSYQAIVNMWLGVHHLG
jgi:hypothetical protein